MQPVKLPMYQIDAFTDRIFAGNPAAVCPLERWLPYAVLQAIAAENNLAETAFFVKEEPDYRLRWFTPVAEVDLCGHATLASAAVIFLQLGFAGSSIRFQTRSGVLTVERRGSGYAMDFPAAAPSACELSPALVEGLGAVPLAALNAFDHIAVYATEQEVRALEPNFARLADLGLRGVVATAPGVEADFVSRFFAPKLGVNEDPVTGSAHCELAPYWGRRLGKSSMRADQLSPRGGTLLCELKGERVILSGRAAHYMTAEIYIPDAD